MSQLTIPEIRINFSWLLYEDISKKITKVEEWELPDGEKCEEWTEAYRQAWAKVEEKVLKGAQEITGLRFYRNVIDITTNPSVIPKSEPLLLNFRNKPETVIDTITHELIHTLLTDNNILSIYGKDRYFQLGAEWQKLFGFEDDFTALVHVPLHAIYKKLYEEVLNDKDAVSRDRKILEQLGASSYLKAWDYVEKESAEEIINKLKKSYAELAEKLEKKS